MGLDYNYFKWSLYVIITALFYFSPIAAFSTTYYTLSSGDWESNIWSTDGDFPCGCQPGTEVNGFTVVINHSVSTDELSIKNGTVEINSNLDIAYDLSIQNGELYLNGNLNIIQGDVDFKTGSLFDVSSGIFYIHNGTLELFNNSIVNISNATLELSTGDLIIYNSSSFNATNSEIYLAEGKFEALGQASINFTLVELQIANNDLLLKGQFYWSQASSLVTILNGDLNISGNATANFINPTCVIIENGNFINNGVSSGMGSFKLPNGFITNNGTFSIDFEWCASQGANGVPQLQNCEESTIICQATNQALPILWIDWNAEYTGQSVEVRWSTAPGTQASRYEVLRKGIDADEFEKIGQIIPEAERSFVKTHFEFVDNEPVEEGIYYYQVRGVDENGNAHFTDIMSVKVKYNTSVNRTVENEMRIFPNPSNGREIHIELGAIEIKGPLSFQIFDMNGRSVFERTFTNIGGDIITLQSNLQAGSYFIKTNSAELQQVLKLQVISQG